MTWLRIPSDSPHAIALGIALLIGGCSNSSFENSSFENDKDEKAYLQRQSDLTPSQWRRLKELEAKEQAEIDRKEQGRREQVEKSILDQERRAESYEARKTIEADRAALKSWLEAAASWDAAGEKWKGNKARDRAEVIRLKLQELGR